MHNGRLCTDRKLEQTGSARSLHSSKSQKSTCFIISARIESIGSLEFVGLTSYWLPFSSNTSDLGEHMTNGATTSVWIYWLESFLRQEFSEESAESCLMYRSM